MAFDIPLVAYKNEINRAIVNVGELITDSNSMFSNDTASSAVVRSDFGGNISIDFSLNTSTNDCFIIGEHRYDLSGKSSPYNFNLKSHDGLLFNNIISSSFTSVSESKFSRLPPHAVGVPNSPISNTNIPSVISYDKITFSGTKFFAIANTGSAVYSSIDLSVWTLVISATSGTFNDITASSNSFFSCGNNGKVGFFDGSTFTSVSITTQHMQTIATDGSTYIIAGNNNEIWKTTDLINFSQITSPSSNSLNVWKGVDNIGFAFVLRSLTEVYTTFDFGLSFSPAFLPGKNINSSYAWRGRYYFVGDFGTVYKTDDFLTFDKLSNTLSTINNDFIVVTDDEIIILASDKNIYISTDFLTFSVTSMSFTNSFFAGIATNGIDFAVACNGPLAIKSFFFRNRYRLEISGLSPNSDINLVEFFIGKSHNIGNINWGYDKERTRSSTKEFKSENGRIFETTMYSRLELKLGLSIVDMATSQTIDTFRKFVYNKRPAVWFSASPDSNEYGTYLMKVKKDIDLNIQSPVHKSSSINLVEYI